MLPRQDGRVRIEEKVQFGTAEGRPLLCDVYHPPEPGTDRPAVLLIHGGGWRTGDRSQLRGYGIALGRLGFVGVACEYRLSDEAAWPAPLHDVKAALRWLRAESTELGVDPARIAASGNSAGAHLALLLGGTANHPGLEGAGGHADASTDCAAVIAIYPPTDLRPAASKLSEAVSALFGGDPQPAALQEASPIVYADGGFPPALLLHGSADEIVPHSESLAMMEALHAAGNDAELHVFSGCPHAFDTDPDLGRQCTSLMALFLERKIL